MHLDTFGATVFVSIFLANRLVASCIVKPAFAASCTKLAILCGIGFAIKNGFG